MIRGFVGSDVETHPAGVCPLEGDVRPRWQEEKDGAEGAAATGYQPIRRLGSRSRVGQDGGRGVTQLRGNIDVARQLVFSPLQPSRAKSECNEPHTHARTHTL